MIQRFKEKIRNRKKGFTLMELLAVIVILAIILVITIPTILGNMNNSKQKSFEVVGKTMKKYIFDNYENCKLGDLVKYDEDLFKEGTCNLKEGILDGSDKSLINNSGYSTEDIEEVIVFGDNGNYELKVMPAAGGKFDGLNPIETGTIVNKPNAPDLSTGLIPVVYDENGTSSKWFVADTSQKWYDYNTQWWANAVSVNISSRDKYIDNYGTYKAYKEDKTPNEISSSDMLAMFVWIPRFSYTIGCHEEGKCYGYKISGASDVSKATPGAIDIKFVPEEYKDPFDLVDHFPTYTYTLGSDGFPTTDRTPNNWYTHPAFTFGDEELSGIWVGKFETSVNPSSDCYNDLLNTNYEAEDNCQASNDDVTPRILPNVLPLVYQDVYNQFETAKKFTSNTIYGLTTNTDSHMMKNSEWGAVAYLSQSIYGKYGNEKYDGTNKEIYSNNSTLSEGVAAGFTGRSAGVASTENGVSVYGTYKYNDIKVNSNGSDGDKVLYSGTGASTTGNIYGIYDMSGGASEYVMGYYTEASSEFGATSSSNSSGFKNQPTPESKYFDGYKGTISGDTKTIDLFTKSNEVIGHATAETNGWYSDSASSISASAPWVVRGGPVPGGNYGGEFYLHEYNGDLIELFSFRSVLATIES